MRFAAIPLVLLMFLCRPAPGQPPPGPPAYDSPMGPRLKARAAVAGFNGIAWQFATGGVVRSAAPVTEREVLVGNGAGSLFCLDKQTGRPRWRFQADGPIHSSPCLAGGNAYFTTRRNT